VSGSARRFATALIFAACLGAPVFEMFDHWDQTAQTSNDTEANVIVVALCVGVALVAVRKLLKPLLTSARHEPVSVLRPNRSVSGVGIVATPDISPPIPLRV
jgi:undecaprenyl pyrophosphate phosphatase UppP